MRVKVIANVPGAPTLAAGDLVDLPADEARAWFASGVAVLAVDTPPAPHVEDETEISGAVEARSVRR